MSAEDPCSVRNREVSGWATEQESLASSDPAEEIVGGSKRLTREFELRVRFDTFGDHEGAGPAGVCDHCFENAVRRSVVDGIDNAERSILTKSALTLQSSSRPALPAPTSSRAILKPSARSRATSRTT